jgi:hypothetical protein
MRTVELAKVAASAEALRLRRIVRRQGLRAAFGAVAGVFAVAALVVLHLVGWHLLASVVTPVQASLILLGIDLVIAIAFGVLAMRDVPDIIEQEALAIRQQAVTDMKASLTMMGIIGGVAGIALRSTAQHGVRHGATSALTALATRLLGR